MDVLKNNSHAAEMWSPKQAAEYLGFSTVTLLCIEKGDADFQRGKRITARTVRRRAANGDAA